MTFWEDANLTMAPLTQSLSRRACFPDQGRGGNREGAPPARHCGWGAHATRCSLRYNSRDPRGPIVYTNAPKWRGEAILANLCTLLRSHGCPQRPNSVHKCPNPARRGRFSQSVYTPASPRPLTRPGGATGSTTSTAPWSRDARALGPEVHAAGAVTHPSTRAHDASYIMQFFAQFNVTKHNSA